MYRLIFNITSVETEVLNVSIPFDYRLLHPILHRNSQKNMRSFEETLVEEAQRQFLNFLFILKTFLFSFQIYLLFMKYTWKPVILQIFSMLLQASID